MNVKPIDKAYGAEAHDSQTGNGFGPNSILLNKGTTCGGHPLILATNGSDRSCSILIAESEPVRVPVKTGANAGTNPNIKHVVIPRYGMMVIQKKPNELMFVTELGGPGSYSNEGGPKLTNVMLTPVAYI